MANSMSISGGRFWNIKSYITLFLIVVASITLTNCGAYKNAVRHSKIRNHKANIARYANYDNKYKDVYAAVYGVVASRYSIARESESRGFIETEWERSSSSLRQSRKRITAEIIGREPPYRVTIQATRKSRSKKTDGWSRWTTKRDFRTEDRLLVQVFELLNGKIDIPPELQKQAKVQDG